MKYLLLFLLSTLSYAESFMPPNNLHLDKSAANSMTESEFKSIINRIVAVYQPDAAMFGARLTVDYQWANNTVNAYADQAGNNWMIAMFGGLARRQETTPDGFALVVCHELGHHFGGFPYYGGETWASSEGQADYWATQVCARRVWARDYDVNARAALTVDPVAKDGCDRAWRAQADRDLCYRAANGGLSLANLLGALNGNSNVRFDTADRTQVPRTDPSHPGAQCRLDTYFAGGLCTVTHRPEFIAGRDVAHHSVAAKAQAQENSCFAEDGFLMGYRSRCWFAPDFPESFTSLSAKPY